MLKLNIISNELKKEIKLKALYHSAHRLMVILLFLAVLYSAVFILSYFFLQHHYNNVLGSSSGVNKGSENYINVVKNINQEVSEIEKIQQESVYWSYLLEYFREAAGPELRLTKYQFDAAKPDIVIGGWADTRESLLDFKSELEESEWFSEVNLPIKNLLLKSDINFDIALKLTSHEFKQD